MRYLDLVVFAVLGSAVAPPTKRAATGTRYLFITGDSYSTTGFNPNNSSQPSPQRQLGNPDYPGLTFSGGDNWVDVVVYNNTNATTTTILGYNYAWGGNTVNISRTQKPNSGFPKDMIDQVSEFSTLVKNQGPFPPPAWTAQNSLFIQWFGINDIYWNGLVSNRTYTEAQPFLVADVGDFYKQLDIMYKLGARQFMSILIPPVSRTPGVVKASKVQLAQNLTNFWNTQIKQQNDGFLSTHSGVSSMIFDPASVFNNILDNAIKYGAPNNTCYSYPAGSPCLWLDDIHPGLTIQRSLGQAIFSKIQSNGFF